MSSDSEYCHAESSPESPPPASQQPSRTPPTPRKRPRVASVDPHRVRKYDLEGKYNDAYRVFFNDQVGLLTAPLDSSEDRFHHYATQVGASSWSAAELATLFTALGRLGRSDIAGIAAAIQTKSIPETQQLLLLLHDAAMQQGDAKITLRDLPAAIDIGPDCSARLDSAGEALAWYQETFEAAQEQDRFGAYWLMTPELASNIEDAIAGRTRATSTPLASEPATPRRGGKQSAGSCISCKQSKLRCNRQSPCSNCARRNIETCVYQERLAKAERTPGLEILSADQEGKNFGSANAEEPSTSTILEQIPEAALLHPQMMLTLSKTLFMNRSPTIPSSWPHWSEYTSELSEEPTIYRSAFNDFHTLVVSVTKRLMQTAIVQATSRLRSQRRRTKKGVLPYVRRRDVLAAIDVVGMKRHGRNRWRGAARRCGVRVFDTRHNHTRSGNPRRELSWDEVEQILDFEEIQSEPQDTDAEPSGNDLEAFRARAARSGTPIPMEQLGLSASDESFSSLEESDASDDDSEDSPVSRAHQPPNFIGSQPRDPLGRYTSIPPMAKTEPGSRLKTLEKFDREASRQQEEALMTMLYLEPPAKHVYSETDSNKDQSNEEGNMEKVITNSDDWRAWSAFHAVWEEFRNPVPESRFKMTSKSDFPFSTVHDNRLHSSGVESEDISTTDSLSDSRQPRERRSRKVVLRTQGPREYAALLGRTNVHEDRATNSEGDIYCHSDISDVGRPAQSIENAMDAPRTANDEAEMDWNAS